MTDVLKIFVAQYLTIFLMGLQSLNVVQKKYVAAAITSCCLGVSGYLTTGIISQNYSQGILSWVFFGFLVAGPVGIVSSMLAHEKYFK